VTPCFLIFVEEIKIFELDSDLDRGFGRRWRQTLVKTASDASEVTKVQIVGGKVRQDGGVASMHNDIWFCRLSFGFENYCCGLHFGFGCLLFILYTGCGYKLLHYCILLFVDMNCKLVYDIWMCYPLSWTWRIRALSSKKKIIKRSGY